MLDFIKRLFGRKRRAVFLSQRTFAPVDHPMRAVFDQRYLDMRAAMASADGNEIAALLAPGFSSLDVRDRETGAAEMIAGVLNLDIDRSKRSAATTIVRLEIDGDRAVLDQTYLMTSTPDAPRSMPERLQALSTDVWQRIDDAWLLAHTKTLEHEVKFRDGRFKHISRVGEGATAEISNVNVVD